MQTRLFIKKSLLDEYREDNGKVSKPSWNDSFVFNEVVKKTLLKSKKSMFFTRV
jgi:hypothetical protein